MKNVFKETLKIGKSGTNLFLICFYVIFYSILFHYCFEILFSPYSTAADPSENHEFLVSEQKKILEELNPFSDTELPAVPEDFSLKISVLNIYEFNENLPYSGFRDRNCTFEYLGISESCSFKLHTTSWWHWGHKYKSYDLDSLKPLPEIQSGRFSLTRPKFLFFPSTIIYSEIAKKYGIYAPEQKIVSFYLNDKFQGPYLLKEKTDASFVAKTIRQPGFMMSHNSKDLIRGYKPAFLNMTLDQYDNTMEANSMLDKESWSISAYVGTEFSAEVLDEMFEKLKHVDKLDEIFDLEYAARQYALDSIFGIQHRQNSNNNSWFVNALTHKFYYIPSDDGPFLFTDAYDYVGGMDFTDLLLKNEKFRKMVDRYLYYFVVEENIYEKIKSEVLKYEKKMRLPIERIKLLTTGHPISFGAMGNTELIFGTFFHNFTYEDFSNEAYLNLASLLKRKETIEQHLNEIPKSFLYLPKRLPPTASNCTIANSLDLANDIKKYCPKGSYEISEKIIAFMGLQNLVLENISTKNLNREKIIFSDIQSLQIRNFIATENSAGLIAVGVKKVLMENIQIANVFGNGITLNYVDKAELKNIQLDRILKIGIDCSNVTNLVRDSVVVANAFQDIKTKNCY